MDWYIGREGKTFGPVTFEELCAGARDGRLRLNDWVWSTGMPNWETAERIPALWTAWNLPGPSSADARLRRASSDTEAAAGSPSTSSTTQAFGPGPGPEPPASSPAKKASLIVRHWRGKLTLAQSYWGIGVLLTFLLVAAGNGLGAALPALQLSPAQTGIMLLVFISFLCLVTVWQLFGIWRSAGNYIKTTGRRHWGLLARVAVVIGALRMLVDINTVIGPIVSESARLAAGVENIPAYQLRILRNGTEIELSGGMPYGTADGLQKLLDAAPAVKVVHLNSLGGRINEAYRIYQLVRDRKLATYTATNCASACAIAFLGGNERYLASQAQLGFHSLSFGGLDQKILPEINAEVERMLAQHGAPQWFIAKALTTPAEDIWYPTHNELMAAKIITRVVDPDQFGWSGMADWHSPDKIESILLSVPVYAVIKTHDPEVYRSVADRFAEGIKAGRSSIEIQRDLHSVVASELLPKYLRAAPDSMLHRYWSVQVEEIRHLAATDARSCVEFLFPETRRPTFDTARLLPQQLMTRDFEALAELVREAAARPHKSAAGPPDRELAGLLTRVSAKVPAIRDVLAEPQRYLQQPAVLCGAILAFYAEIVALPARRAGPILRSLNTR